MPHMSAARRLRLIVVVLALAVALSAPSVALAHALLVRSDPAADALLPHSPTRVHLWFSEDLNGAASQIVVWDRYRHVENVGHASIVSGQPRQMEVPLKPLHAGSYLVLWTSVSAQDGHVLRGSYLFSVKRRGPGPAAPSGESGAATQGPPDLPTGTGIVGHWTELLASVAWLGAAAFSALIVSGAAVGLGPDTARAEARRRRYLILGSLIVLVVSSVAVIGVLAYDLANGDWATLLTRANLSSLFAQQYGQLWLVRQAIVVGAIVLVTLNVGGRRPGSAAIQLALAVVYMYVFAASGHAASSNVGDVANSHIFSVAVGLDWLHFLVDGLWFGGQIYIVAVLIPALRLRGNPITHGPAFLRALNRFSPVAYLSVAVYAVTGLFAAKIHIPSWYAYFHSVYGWALTVKMALIGLMMLTSAYTVFVVRPHLGRVLDGARLRHLLGWLRVNPVLGAGVLLATSVMFSYPVPFGLAPPGPSAYAVQSSGLHATLTIAPDHSGPNRITVLLKDLHGRPVRLAHVSVLTTMLDMVMGTGLASLHEAAPGRFTGTTDLGMGGNWRLQLLVYQPNGLTRMSVDVKVGT